MAKSYSVLLILLGALVLSSCSSITTVNFPAQRPPEVDVTPYRSMIVDPIESSSMFQNDGGVLRNMLIEKLLATRLFDAVSDAHPANNDLRSTLLIGGAIVVDNYTEKSTKTEEVVGRKVRNPLTKKDTVIKDSLVRHNERNGVLNMSAQIRLRDGAQNAILWSTTFDVQRVAKTTATNSRPDEIYVPALQRDAIDELSNRLVHAFLVRDVTERVELVIDDDIPQLEKGNDEASHREWQKAINYYNDAMMVKADQKNIHKAMYNFACVNMIIGNYDTAIRHFEKAMGLASSGETRYRAARDLCLRLQADTETLKKYRR